jgi:hypothetical protein
MAEGLVVSFLIGAAIGLATLVSRYRDSPLAVLRGLFARFFLAINGAASALAFLLIVIFDWKVGIEAEGDALWWARVLVAGFGAAALFRSSLFTVRAGDTEVAVGPK